MDPVRPTDPSQASAPDAPTPDAPTAEELQAIRARAESAIARRRKLNQELEERLEESLAAISEDLAAEADAVVAAQRDSLEEARSEFDAEREAWRSKQEAADQEFSDELAQLDAIRESVEQGASDAQRRLAEQHAATRADLQAKHEAELSSLRASLAADLGRTMEAHANKLADSTTALNDDLAAAREEREAARNQVAELQQSLSQAKGREAELAEQLKAAERQQQAASDQAAAAGADAQVVAQLKQQLGEAEQTLQQTRADAEAREAALAAQLAAAEAGADQSDTFAELESRFELAVADAQKHRLRIDELEQELAERPAAANADSAEVAHLREEVDRLRDQLAELESRPPTPAGDGSEEVEELQRRFEMAVEDVRELKRENQELQDRLAAAPASSGGEDANDWEAQKRRLLASLEGEGEHPEELTPERVEERTTIEGTIQITDEVIMGKDQVIADLQQRLSEAQTETTTQLSDEFADDERLEAERARLQDLEAKLNEQLRKTELELSVERAAIARQKAEFEQKLIELESAQASHPAPVEGGGGDDGRRQSNWLRKLGLGGEE